MHIHILGICGTFMGGVAALARAQGHQVSGCDANVYPPMSEQLQQLGIHIIQGWEPSQLDLKPDLWVIGNVVSRGNPLMEAILNQGQRYVCGPQWLADNILQGRWVLGVAGTHGKTTTASMLAWILQFAGREPGFLIGGVPQNFAYSAQLGSTATANSPFVVEADEYDSAFFDKRSKFVHYHPRTAILNNLEYDHADIFPDLAAIETQFHHLVRTVPGNGCVIAPQSSAALDRVLQRGCWSQLERFGPGSTWQLRGSEQAFDILFEQQVVAQVAWEQLGQHNMDNALAAVTAAQHAGGAPAVAGQALSQFQGVKRRMQKLGEVAGIRVFDDFAHHPTAIATTLAGVRKRWPGQRILAVFEPRSNTMKQGAIKDQLPTALADADFSFCYAAGLGWDAQATLAPLGNKVQVHQQIDALLQALVAQAKAGDIIVVMSNGGFAGIHQKLLLALRQQ